MPQTYAGQFVHCVFSTKYRRDTIPPTLQNNLYGYFRGIAKNLDIELLAAGGTANHVHLLIGLPSKMSLAEAVQNSKRIPRAGSASRASILSGKEDTPPSA